MSDWDEQRRFPRIRTENPVHVRKIGDEGREECAKTSTLGLGGCMFIAAEPLGGESIVDLLISVRPKRVIEARGRVIYEVPHETVPGAQAFEVGVEFLSISEPDRLALEELFEAPRPK
jgi:hypothetical protein